MNKEEYYKTPGVRRAFEYKFTHSLLKQWKNVNNHTCKCVIHHRDDTEETRKYNEEHYELWGFNLDGTFEYGKYVVFMTNAEHVSYHSNNRSEETLNKLRKENHWNYGKHWSAETKQKMSVSHKGFKHTTESKQKMSESRKGENNGFYGKRHSEETVTYICEVRKQQMKIESAAYKTYKANGGKCLWHEFRKLFHRKDSQVMQYLTNDLYKENIS